MSAPVDLDALEQAVAAMSSEPWTLDPTDDDIIAPDDAVKHPDGSTGNVVHHDIDSLRRLLAEAKRLGLEACHIARADRDDATEVDVARIAAALEAL